jgi:predicted glycoside hydrolase/deacetylase ChbG (UPF0249 family)
MRPPTLCADDLGQSQAISQAIIDLAEHGRLNAAALMVDGPEAPAAAARIARLSGVALGLHLTLSGSEIEIRSDFAPGGRLPSADALAARAFAGRLPRAAIAREIERQYDRFEDLAGAAPAFVDGPQHVHVLPGIRPVFLDAARRRAPGAWIRTCEERASVIWERGAFRWLALRSALLSRGLSAAAARAGLRTNRGFAGLYDFKARCDYGRLFERWQVSPGEAPLLICHPALLDRSDPIGAARAREYDFLKSRSLNAPRGAARLRLVA